MNNREVAHLWAAQNRASAKGSNFYFDGPTIYSYGSHFPIARFTDRRDANGERVVLFTCEGYSMSTSRHINYTRSALHGLNVRVLSVPNVGAESNSEHSANLRHYAEIFERAVAKASKARKNGAQYIANAERAQHEAADYCAIFSMPSPAFLDDEISPELMATLRERAKREALENAEKRERQVAARAAEYAQKIAAWRAGASEHECELWRFAGKPTAIRLRDDVIETSRGATVPATVARNLWRLVNEARKNGAAIFPRRSRVGDYELRTVNADGSLVIGCHEIPFSELELMARQLNFTAE